jgi:hypothetical protein
MGVSWLAATAVCVEPHGSVQPRSPELGLPQLSLDHRWLCEASSSCFVETTSKPSQKGATGPFLACTMCSGLSRVGVGTALQAEGTQRPMVPGCPGIKSLGPWVWERSGGCMWGWRGGSDLSAMRAGVGVQGGCRGRGLAQPSLRSPGKLRMTSHQPTATWRPALLCEGLPGSQQLCSPWAPKGSGTQVDCPLLVLWVKPWSSLGGGMGALGSLGRLHAWRTFSSLQKCVT